MNKFGDKVVRNVLLSLLTFSLTGFRKRNLCLSRNLNMHKTAEIHLLRTSNKNSCTASEK